MISPTVGECLHSRTDRRCSADLQVRRLPVPGVGLALLRAITTASDPEGSFRPPDENMVRTAG
jgi:hypothetical protein